MSSSVIPIYVSDLHYSRGNSTRNLCICGLIFSWIFAISSLYLGIVWSSSWVLIDLHNSLAVELIILVQSILITISNESLGYIHTTSLRWSLHREGRLRFSSNIRLFSSTYAFGPNAWYFNVLVLFGIIVTYGATALTLQPVYWQKEKATGFLVSGPAFILLGCGVVVQASIATWALLARGTIPTWSSHLLDTTAAALSTSPGLNPGPRLIGPCATHAPQSRRKNFQPSSAYSSVQGVRTTIHALFGLFLLLTAWTFTLLILMLLLENRPVPPWKSLTTSWNPFSPDNRPVIIIPWQNPSLQVPTNSTQVFLLICALQSSITISLHLAELAVNTFRDELDWAKFCSSHFRTSGQRHISQGSTLQLNSTTIQVTEIVLDHKTAGSSTTTTATDKSHSSNALMQLFSCWQCTLLFLAKPFVNWILSLSFGLRYQIGVVWYAPQTLYLWIALSMILGFVVVLMFWKVDTKDGSSQEREVSWGELLVVRRGLESLDWDVDGDSDGEREHWP